MRQKYNHFYFRHDIENNESMDVLASLVSSLYSIKKFRKKSSLTLETIYQYLLSHSRFLPILLEEEYDKDTKGTFLLPALLHLICVIMIMIIMTIFIK